MTSHRAPVAVWAFAAAAVLWALALPAAAAAASESDPGSAWRAFSVGVFTIGRFICHQRPERSFHLWAVPLPVCARCLGIYAGAAIVGGACVLSAFGRTCVGTSRLASRDTPNVARLVLAAGALPTLATLVYEWSSGRVPTNALRALAGAPIGAAAAFIVVASLMPRPSKP